MQEPQFVKEYFRYTEQELGWRSRQCLLCGWVHEYSRLADGHPAMFHKLAFHVVTQHVALSNIVVKP